MSIFNKSKKGGVADVIRCDESNYLIWKWHPNRYNQGDLKRETAIRTNSVLRVKTGEVAVFVYKQKEGNNEDYIVGPYDETLKSKNFPVLSSIIGLWFEGNTPFQAEVFFINLGESVQLKFGVPYFDVVDPRYPDFTVPISVRGTLTFKIDDYKKFVKCHQLASFNMDDLYTKLKDVVNRYVRNEVANASIKYQVSVISIDSKHAEINEAIENEIKAPILEGYGVTVTRFDISTIDINKESQGYVELKKLTKDITMRKAEVDFVNYEEQLRIQREEGQYAQHMGTRTANIGAYQTEVKGEVGVASANALGKMGENGAGNVNMGGAGFNPMQMMAGIAVGSVVGKNIAGVMDDSLNPASQNVPPVIPVKKYYVAKDGKPTGPYEISQLEQLIISGELIKETLIWTQGMSEWEKAIDNSDIKVLFPPEISTK